MKSYDFEYDGIRLSDKGFIICKFDSDSVETVSNGSEITFNTVSTMNGMKHELTSSAYEDYLSATFQICKNPCYGEDEEISFEDMRDIMRWLNRKSFHEFRLLDVDYSNVIFEASFNVSRVEINGKLYGFELEMFTNRPFAIQRPVSIVIKNTAANVTRTIFNKSDEEGFVYPNMKITVDSDGDLEMFNAFENRTMRIANCKAGEVITIDYPIITSSLASHKIQNDFNWVFFRLASSFKNRMNDVSISLPCTVELEYSPVVKTGI